MTILPETCIPKTTKPMPVTVIISVILNLAYSSIPKISELKGILDFKLYIKHLKMSIPLEVTEETMKIGQILSEISICE